MTLSSLFLRLRVFLQPRRWLYPVLIGVIVFLALLLLVLLAAASANTEFFDEYFSLLYKVNLVVGALLVLIVGSLVLAVWLRLRRGKFGTRLMAKLAFFFAVVGVLPGVIIYLVSYQFVSRSIESWFDVKVESALEAGLNLGRTAMEVSLSDLQDKARVMAEQLSASRAQKVAGDSNATLTLARLREQFSVEEATLVGATGQVVASVSARYNDSSQELPTPDMLNKAHQGRGFGAIEEDDTPPIPSAAATGSRAIPTSAISRNPQFRLRSVVVVPGYTGLPTNNLLGSAMRLNLASETLYLQVVQRVPNSLARNAEDVQNAYREYQEKALGRSGLRKMYIGTLTLTLFLAVFVAVMLALLLGSQLARPLLLLLQGTKEVAEGDLSPKRVLPGNDELGMLTQHFSQMTRQLADARGAVEENRLALEDSKAYLESILSNLTAGVLVFDHRFCLSTANAGAERIFKQPFAAQLGQSIDQMQGLGEFVVAIRQAFREQEAQAALFAKRGTSEHWQKQLAVDLAGEAESLTLLVRGTRLSSLEQEADGAGSYAERGYVVVFDDISDVIAAQRSIAWGEVARRLAHEIKNPLTPIQLSAERLQMKLSDKLPPAEAEILRKGATTIVNQVAAMKQMVDDFRDYARLPPAVPQAIQLNALAGDILNLYGVDSPSAVGDIGPNHVRIEAQLGEALPLVLGDATQIRQVIHNLMQNAQDTVEDNLAQGRAAPCVRMQTEAVEYPNANGEVQHAVRLTVRDNGPGFAPRVLHRAFEPYITTKAKGTGLGLAMVKKIVDEHGARIELRNLDDTATRSSSTIDGSDTNAVVNPPQEASSAGTGAQVSILFLRLAEATPSKSNPSAPHANADNAVQGA